MQLMATNELLIAQWRDCELAICHSKYEPCVVATVDIPFLSQLSNYQRYERAGLKKLGF